MEKEFGTDLARIVEGLTDPADWAALPLRERKCRQANRVARESNSVKRAKLADQASNVKIVGSGNDRFTPENKLIYLETAKLIADACKGVSPYLDHLFMDRYDTARENLKILAPDKRSLKKFWEREKYVALHAQSRRFRVWKWIIILVIGAGLYFWKGWMPVLAALILCGCVGIALHFLLRWKTCGWTKSWGPYKRIRLNDE